MNCLPSQELLDTLIPAYAPCKGFSGKCRGVARWCPTVGHFPRGFIGAFGDLEEVQLVIVVAEPGDPFTSDRLGRAVSPLALIAETCRATFDSYDKGKDQFHRNVRFLLNCVFREMPLKQQLVRTWITEFELSRVPRRDAVPAARASRWSCL